MPFQLYIAVGLGGALGTFGRYAVSGVVAHAFGETFPWGTLIVNVTGSFIIGFFATLTAPDGRLFVGGTTRQFVMTGLCGGYTTFSSFSLQTLNLMRVACPLPERNLPLRSRFFDPPSRGGLISLFDSMRTKHP